MGPVDNFLMAVTRGRSCEGKRPYALREEAENARWNLIRQTGMAAHNLKVYKCKFGKHWHVGHPVRRRHQK